MQQPLLPVDSEALRQAMRTWATGVAIVSAIHDGVHHGMTVNSFTSVSLTPPLVLVALQKKARTVNLVTQSGYFGVTVLQATQQALADRFAGRQEQDEDRFRDLELFTLLSGAPFVSGGMAYFDCRLAGVHDLGAPGAPGGTALFLGEVLATQVFPERQPLLYYNRAYRFLGDEL